MSGGGGGDSSNTTTTTRTELAAEQKPYVTDVLTQAQGLSKTPISYFPGQTYANPAAETNLALDAQAGRAIMGSPVTGAMNQQLTDTLSGNYLSAGNPYFGNVANQIGNQVQNQMDSRFNTGGRLNSGAHQAATASALSDKIGQLAYQNYGDERTKQIQSMLFAPQAAQNDYFDIAKLAEVGGLREDQSQQAINDQMARYNFTQQEPWQRLMQYGSLAYGGNLGNSSTATTTGPKRSAGADMLGGLSSMAGAGMMAYNMFSDRRVKEDVRQVGLLNNGLPVYAYRYKWGGPEQIGVMAQDVEKVHPEAVSEIAGVKTVNYGQAVQ